MRAWRNTYTGPWGGGGWMTFEPDGSDLLGEVGTLRMFDRDGGRVHEWVSAKLKWCEEAAAEAKYVPCRASAVASEATEEESDGTE